jgi:ABC-type transport system involved in multi-copper enzyme maturation permease subunit
VLVGLWLFFLTCVFPVTASVLPAGPVWVGWLDVVLAFAVTALALFVFAISYRQVDDAARLTSFHVYRILAYIPIILLAAFFVFGKRIDWTVLLAGPCVAVLAGMLCPAGSGKSAQRPNSHSISMFA